MIDDDEDVEQTDRRRPRDPILTAVRDASNHIWADLRERAQNLDLNSAKCTGIVKSHLDGLITYWTKIVKQEQAAATAAEKKVGPMKRRLAAYRAKYGCVDCGKALINGKVGEQDLCPSCRDKTRKDRPNGKEQTDEQVTV